MLSRIRKEMRNKVIWGPNADGSSRQLTTPELALLAVARCLDMQSGLWPTRLPLT
jgi:hypothetical protein